MIELEPIKSLSFSVEFAVAQIIIGAHNMIPILNEGTTFVALSGSGKKAVAFVFEVSEDGKANVSVSAVDQLRASKVVSDFKSAIAKLN